MWWLAFLALGCKQRSDFDLDGFSEPADCDDNDASSFPGASEVPYDGKDQDCDGADLVDQDLDGFQAEEAGGPDCNDLRDDVSPGAVEVPYDGVDADCDGWSDDDFDRDGYEARGHGGEDCDDNDPLMYPIDIDGDGYSPCAGDCDESDPDRNSLAEPVCGNGVDDDCDFVSDCTLVGIYDLAIAETRIVATESAVSFGKAMLAPGDLDGDGEPDLLVSGELPDGMRALWFYSGPFDGAYLSDDAFARLDFTFGTLALAAVDDLDGDGFPEILIGESSAASGVPHAWIRSAPVGGISTLGAGAVLDVVGAVGDHTGESVGLVGDRVAIGATGLGEGEVNVVPLSSRGQLPFGEAGVTLVGDTWEYTGASVLGMDTNRDGVDDLVVGAPGDWHVFAAAVYVVEELPQSGRLTLGDAASVRIDMLPWGRAGEVLTQGDLDGDGAPDLVIGAPQAEQHIGAVAIWTEVSGGDSSVEDAPIQRLGLGDDTFGQTLVARDFDEDGADDLVVGAPASWSSGGGNYKPGAVHVWYGPLEDGLEYTFTADLFLGGAYSGYRTQAGTAIVVNDLDGDGYNDLAVSSPALAYGQIDFFPGGATGQYGW